MKIETNAESHLDHGVPLEEVLEALRAERAVFRVRVPGDAFVIAEVTVAQPVTCALVGPLTGQPPVLEVDVFYAPRSKRPNPSRLTRLRGTVSNTVTVIASGGFLVTAYGGPLAPQEVDDPYLKPEAREASVAFWKAHALAAPEAPAAIETSARS